MPPPPPPPPPKGRQRSWMARLQSALLKITDANEADVPSDSPLRGHSLWDLALIMLGLARIYLLFSYSFILEAKQARNTPAGPRTGATSEGS